MTPKDDPLPASSTPCRSSCPRPRSRNWTGTTRHWSRSRLQQGVARLKQDGNGMVLIFGSGELVRSLLRVQPDRELRLWVFRWCWAKGNGCSTRGVRAGRAQLQEARPFSTGVTLQRYQPAGKPSYGSFLNHNPAGGGAEAAEAFRGVAGVVRRIPDPAAPRVAERPGVERREGAVAADAAVGSSPETCDRRAE
jgi:hypothetical protein